MRDDVAALRFQLARQIGHWRGAVHTLSNPENFASTAAWHGLERELRITIRRHLGEAVAGLRREIAVLDAELAAADSSASALEDLRRRLVRFRRRFVQVEAALDLYGDMVNSRTGPRLAALLRACDILAVQSMAVVLEPLGRPVPPVITYVDKGMGASLLRAGLRLAGGLTVAGAIKITRHNLLPAPTALLHEAGHQVAHLLHWNEELAAVLHTELAADPVVAEAWAGWAAETTADAFAFAHAGYGAVAVLHDVLAGERARVFTNPPLDPHPVGFLRVLLGVAMARRFYGAGPWDDLEKAWMLSHPLSAAPPTVRDFLQRCLPWLPRIVECCLLHPMRAFGDRPLTAFVDPLRVRPDALRQLAADAGPSLYTSPHWLRSEALRLLALSAWRTATEPEKVAEVAVEFENWMLQLGRGVPVAA